MNAAQIHVNTAGNARMTLMATTVCALMVSMVTTVKVGTNLTMFFEVHNLFNLVLMLPSAQEHREIITFGCFHIVSDAM